MTFELAAVLLLSIASASTTAILLLRRSRHPRIVTVARVGAILIVTGAALLALGRATLFHVLETPVGGRLAFVPPLVESDRLGPETGGLGGAPAEPRRLARRLEVFDRVTGRSWWFEMDPATREVWSSTEGISCGPNVPAAAILVGTLYLTAASLTLAWMISGVHRAWRWVDAR